MIPVNDTCQSELDDAHIFLESWFADKFFLAKQRGDSDMELTVMSHGAGTQTSVLYAMAGHRRKFDDGDVGYIDMDFAMYSDVGDFGTECEWPDTIDYMHRLKWYCRFPLIHVHPCDWDARLMRRVDGLTDRDNGRGVSGLFDCYERNETIPIRKFRGCTSDFKVKPQINYLSAIRDLASTYGIELSFRQILGYSADEQKRADRYDSGYPWITGYFPLIEWGLNRDDTLEFARNNFGQMINAIGLPKKSGCWFCPFQKRGKYDPVTLEPTPRSWLALKHQHPDLMAQAIHMEDRQNERRDKSGKGPIYLYGNKPLGYWIRPQNVQAGFDFGEGDKSGDDTCVSGYCFV